MNGRAPEGNRDRVQAVRVLIAGGGTGGHVYPGLAVAEALQALEPRIAVRFAGTRRGLEALLVPRAGYRLYTVPASGFRGMGPGARLRFLFNFAAGLVRAIWLLLRWRPAVVLGTGGYASAPVLAAARLLWLPTALQEQNAMPGSANRLLARWANRIYLGFARAAEHLPAERCRVTGNPVRAAFAEENPADVADAPQAEVRTGAGNEPLRLLVFGGSRGARTLNRSVQEAADTWLEQPRLAIWIQTGPSARHEVTAAFERFEPGRVRIDAYLFDMPSALRWADLVVCRAGALTLAELALLGKPAVLVPFPHATDDHQLKNARELEAAGAAAVLTDAECNGRTLAASVAQFLDDRTGLEAMGRAARERGRPEAAREIASDLLRMAGLAPNGIEERDVP